MNGTQTPLSVNEVRFFFTRAAVGAGVPFGLGEDFAKAAIWLATMGADPAGVAAPALQSQAEGKSDAHIISHSSETSMRFMSKDSKPLSVLYTGPSVADQLCVAVANGESLQLVVENVDQPALLAAYLASAEIEGAAIAVSWIGSTGDTTRIEIAPDGTCAFASGDNQNLLAGIPANMEVTCSNQNLTDRRWQEKQPTTPRRDVLEQGVEVGAESWAVVLEFFRKCLVPSSQESLEQGAGAGMTDND